tara:strand:- start:4386 stop:5525 length:1140 start_codon:yes stop_codon:yes gene_type:complete
MNTKIETFSPDYIIPPGEILEETLEARGIKKKEFAERCGRTAKMISEIIAGKAAITPETALQFERVLGISAALWSNLETKYRLRLAEKEECERLEQHTGVLENFSSFIGQLEKRGFIQKSNSPAQKLANLIKFFGVGGVEALDNRLDAAVSFRKTQTFKSDPYALNTWLRCGEIKAADIDIASYDADKFKKALYAIRKLTTAKIEDAIPQAVKLCAEAGVALVVIPEIKGSCVNGAARWISKDKALIQLSGRYLVDDIFWFTFFHEAGHILLHGKKDVYIDEGEVTNDKQEQEADTFAQNILVPKDAWWEFMQMMNWSVDAIQHLANKLEIAPGIIVGRLQHHEKEVTSVRPNSKAHNALKSRYKWDEKEQTLLSKESN